MAVFYVHNYFEGRQVIEPDDLEDVSVTSAYKDLDGTPHKLIRDSFKRLRGHSGYIAIIGCESQKDINRAMPVKDMIAFELEEDYSVIEKIHNVAKDFAPDYDEDKVYDSYRNLQ